MAEGGTERRLTVIVAIDVAGYSRLMGADEDGTLSALKGHREPTVLIGERHGGRVVGLAGDVKIWELPSVIEAVHSAIEVQALKAERNADVPDERKMLYRIGINLGDAMIDCDDIYGDGINVAATPVRRTAIWQKYAAAVVIVVAVFAAGGGYGPFNNIPN